MNFKFFGFILISFLFVFLIVLAWKEPVQMPTDYTVIDTSETSQYKNGDLFLTKIVDSIDDGYFIDLSKKDLSINFAGAIKLGEVSMNCTDAIEGAVKYDSNLKNLQICIEKEWRILQQEIIQVVDIIGDHSYEECIDKGGFTVDVSGGKLCFFNGKTCPSEWSQYKNYSSTIPKTTSGSSVGYSKHTGCYYYSAPACNTGFHTLKNKGIESCTSTGVCDGSCAYARCYQVGMNPSSSTAYADMIQIGCY